jgi:hypothetical protein
MLQRAIVYECVLDKLKTKLIEGDTKSSEKDEELNCLRLCLSAMQNMQTIWTRDRLNRYTCGPHWRPACAGRCTILFHKVAGRACFTLQDDAVGNMHAAHAGSSCA